MPPLLWLLPLIAQLGAGPAPVLFSDDFESGLDGWEITGGGVSITSSGDAAHGSVLVLDPHGDVLALIRGSENWDGVQLDFEFLFPTDEQNYLGVVYNAQRRGDRHDFGLIYIKGNGSYLRVNPHRDFNVGRTLYEEYRTALEGEAAVRIGEWQRGRVEIIGRTCHFYVGDFSVPQLTFSLVELEDGGVGVQPRSVGGPVWVDNVTARSIRRFSYDGPPIPDPQYLPDSLITTWQVAGPFARTRDELARRPAGHAGEWTDFPTDARGAVISARVADYHGPRTVAYFRTRVEAAEDGPAVLHLSTVDDLALWVNGRFHWFIPRGRLAWYDFWSNEEHAGIAIPIELRAGANELVLRARGGVYATGGFFARVEPYPEDP